MNLNLPFTPDEVFQPWNNLVIFRKDGKEGVYDLNTNQFTEPVFESTNLDPETNLLKVYLNGVEGVLTINGLHFVPMSEFDEVNGEYLYNVE
jgi:hypothetical protein